jgi:hypothetical protein
MKNFKVWHCNTTGYGAIYMTNNNVNPVLLEDIYLDHCANAFMIEANTLALEVVLKNIVFGSESINGTDLVVNGSIFLDIIFDTPL